MDLRSELTFSVVDLLLLTACVGVGAALGVATIAPVGVYAALALMLWCRTRRIRYAAVPGAAVAAILAWATLPFYSVQGLLVTTALATALGAGVNAILCGFRLSGWLVIVAVVLPQIAFGIISFVM